MTKYVVVEEIPYEVEISEHDTIEQARAQYEKAKERVALARYLRVYLCQVVESTDSESIRVATSTDQ
jgi:hypothetical protein